MRWRVLGALAAAAGLGALVPSVLEAATPPAVFAYVEAREPSTFLPTILVHGRSLQKVRDVEVRGPSPGVGVVNASLAATGKELVVVLLAATPPAGDYTLTLRDRRGVAVASMAVRLGGSGGGGGSTDAQTLQGLPASAFVRTTGGTLTGPLSIQDGSGVVRTTLNASGIGWRDTAGRLRWSAGGTPSGTGGSWVYDSAGGTRIEVAEAPGSAFVVSVGDSAARRRATLFSLADGDGSLVIGDASGVGRVVIGHDTQTDVSGALFHDGAAALRASVGEHDGSADVRLYAPGEVVRAVLYAEDLFGALTVTDGLGNSTTVWP